MVHIKPTLLVLVSFAVSCMSAATVSSIETDINNMMSQAISLEQTFKSINSVNWMFSATNLHTGVDSLASAMNQIADDIKAMPTQPASVADATTILKALQPLQILGPQFLQTLTSNKATLTKIPVIGSLAPAVVKQELLIVSNAATNLENVMMAATPDSLKSNATAIKTAIDNSLQSALKAYN
ncbi:hypothetical protein BDZ97DRAFT_2074361 [Flammula alnicola]|nr:hypothetical protein BDZ97DRAFT_2074361 [Flammula alnicola]